jgi:transposase
MSRRLVDGKEPEGRNQSTGAPPILELNPELAQNIVNAIRMGNYLSVACSMHGVTYRRLHEWIGKGKEKPESIYGAFAQSVMRAVSEAETRDLSTVDAFANGRAAQYERQPKGHPKEGELILDPKGNPILIRAEIKPNWQAAAWKLERRAPNRWGRFDRVHHSAEEEARSVNGNEHEAPEAEKAGVLNEVRELIGAIDELGDLDDEE